MDDLVRNLAKVLNSHGTFWGIGGSYLLKAYGIVEEVQDLDIIVAEEDLIKALASLDSIAKRQFIPMKKEYKTRHFFVYSYKGLSIDVMSGFRIEHSQGVYEFMFDETSIVKKKDKDGVILPFTSLEDWLIAYKLMRGRQAKVEMIEKYLKSEGISHKNLLERDLKQELPQEIKDYIKSILKNI